MTKVNAMQRPKRLEFAQLELILQLYILVLVLYQEHIHQQEGVSHRLCPGVVIEENPHLGGLQLGRLNAENPGLQLLLLVEIVVPVEPVISLFLALIPDVVISPMETQIGMICGQLTAKMQARAIDEDVCDVLHPQDLQDLWVQLLPAFVQPALMSELHGVIAFLSAETASKSPVRAFREGLSYLK
jgi:hypothetical protein